MNSPVSRVDLISTGSLFHAFGAATSKALSEETSLVLGTSSSCLMERERKREREMDWAEVDYDCHRRIKIGKQRELQRKWKQTMCPKTIETGTEMGQKSR